MSDSSPGPRQLRFVLAWAELHQDELSENRKLAQAGSSDRPAPMIGLTPDMTEAPCSVTAGTVTWPGGADLPDTLYERIRTGAWPEQDVAA